MTATDSGMGLILSDLSMLQRCNTIFTSDADIAQAMAAAGADKGPFGLGPWCCLSFCFVNSSCSTAVPYPTFVDDRDTSTKLYASYDACVDNEDMVCFTLTSDPCYKMCLLVAACHRESCSM